MKTVFISRAFIITFFAHTFFQKKDNKKTKQVQVRATEKNFQIPFLYIKSL